VADVKQQEPGFSAKARQAAAQSCLNQGSYSEGITLSYYACYQAMWVAVGNPPAGLWRHGGLINEFCRDRWQAIVVSPQMLAPLRKKLDGLYLHRVQSDYEAKRLTEEKAREGLDTTSEIFLLVAQHTGLLL
jgi:uncharacterized protein (UPF0332 family)